MREENLFALMMVATIVLTRVSVWFVPNVDLMFAGRVWHHVWVGLLLLSLYLVVPLWKGAVAAVGLGLILDELVFLALGGGNDPEYWSRTSRYGTVLVTLACVRHRKWLLYRVFHRAVRYRF